MFKLMGKKIFIFLRTKNCLSKPMWADPEGGGGGGGAGGRNPHGKLQVAIGFIRNTGTRSLMRSNLTRWGDN